MDIKTILLIFLPIITAIVSSYLTYFFTLRSHKNEVMLRFKEEKYSNLVLLLQGFIGVTSSGDLKRKFYEEQYKSWLYCSDDVVRAMNNMTRSISGPIRETRNPEEDQRVIGSIVLEMRKDLLGKTSLSHKDFTYISIVPDKSR